MSRNHSEFYLERVDDVVELYPEAVKAGYSFKGWQDMEGNPLSADSLVHGKTYYANYADETPPIMSIEVTKNIATSQTITFHAEDEGSGVAGYYFGMEDPVAEGVAYVISNTATVTGEGNYFYAVKDQEGNVTSEEITFYVLSLNLNGGSLATDKIILAEGSTITLPNPVKSGYSGTWIEDATGVTVKEATADCNKSYSVKWKANQSSSTFCGIAVHGGTDSNGNIISVCSGCGKRMDAIGQYHTINN